MRNILFPFIGKNLGGSHVSAFLLATALQSRYSDRITVICPSETLISQVAEKHGFSVIHTQDPPVEKHTPLYDVSQTLNRIGIIRNFNHKNSIIHFNDIRAMQSWILPAKLRRIPILYHNRALNPFGRLKRVFVSSADHFVSISDICSQNMGFIPPSRRQTVTNPFQLPDAARSRDTSDNGQTIRKPIIGFVGNFWQRKRPQFFIDTAKNLNTTHPQFRFAIYGREGDVDLDDLKSYASSLNIDHIIDFHGFKLSIDDDLAAMTALAVPATDEPFGRTLVEAILAGTPYVATASGGHNEIHQRWQGGILAPVDATPEKFAASLATIIDAPQNVSLNTKRIQEVADEVSVENHADQISLVYQHMLGNKGPKPIATNTALAR